MSFSAIIPLVLASCLLRTSLPAFTLVASPACHATERSRYYRYGSFAGKTRVHHCHLRVRTIAVLLRRRAHDQLVSDTAQRHDLRPVLVVVVEALPKKSWSLSVAGTRCI